MLTRKPNISVGSHKEEEYSYTHDACCLSLPKPDVGEPSLKSCDCEVIREVYDLLWQPCNVHCTSRMFVTLLTSRYPNSSNTT